MADTTADDPVASDQGKQDGTVDNVRSMDEAKRRVAEQVNKTREVVGEQLHVAREKLGNVASEMGERFQEASQEFQAKSQVARAAAKERYAKTSAQLQDGYVRVRKDAEVVAGDVNDFVRQNPGTAVLIAAGAGFLVGLLMRPRQR